MGRRWRPSWVTTWRGVVTTASSCGRCSCSSCGTTATSILHRQGPQVDAAVLLRRSDDVGPERNYCRAPGGWSRHDGRDTMLVELEVCPLAHIGGDRHRLLIRVHPI